MRSSSAWDRHVFRKARKRIPGARLVADMATDVGARRFADAVVRAGEIESALADAENPAEVLAARVTDALAARIVGTACDPAPLLEALSSELEGSGELWVSAPEGFSYYALTPHGVAERAGAPPLSGERNVAVLGIRSIGSTMSALVVAALRAKGARADRSTVRPVGHPYDRQTTLAPAQAAWLAGRAASGARVVVVDEGPGASGSSLISAVEAAQRVGVPRNAITVVCTRQPDLDALLAPQASARWAGLRVAIVSASGASPPAGYRTLPPGAWREALHGGQSERAWRRPGSWLWLERAKALRDDGRSLLKFEGLGRMGEEAIARAEILGETGFSPRAAKASDGWVRYAVVGGSRPLIGAASVIDVDRLAEYCAFRADAFTIDADAAPVAEALAKNGDVAFGRAPEGRLDVVRPTIADARMMPFEWVRTPDGTLVKTDGVTHGDDHLFPGPTDIAWDLAGIICEWRLARSQAERFISAYTARTGDDPRLRLPVWLMAYGIQRVARVELAAASVGHPAESALLAADAARARRWVHAAARAGLFGPANRWLGSP